MRAGMPPGVPGHAEISIEQLQHMQRTSAGAILLVSTVRLLSRQLGSARLLSLLLLLLLGAPSRWWLVAPSPQAKNLLACSLSRCHQLLGLRLARGLRTSDCSAMRALQQSV